jgi:hypothetical protein
MELLLLLHKVPYFIFCCIKLLLLVLLKWYKLHCFFFIHPHFVVGLRAVNLTRKWIKIELNWINIDTYFVTLT